MTAVAEMASQPAEKIVPSEAQLLDVLYEVLAQGAPPKSDLSVEMVERFLHEHARNKKPIAEFQAFFASHGLSTDAASYGTDPALRELAQGLQRERAPISASFDLDAPENRLTGPNESGPMRKLEVTQIASENTAPRAIAQSQVAKSSRRGQLLTWLAAGCAAALGVAAFVSFRHAQELEAKLNEARLQQRSTDVALMDIERRAEVLRGSLDQSESARLNLATRFDDFVAAEAQTRAAEAAALERILGKRFETLRDKALSDAMSGSSH